MSSKAAMEKIGWSASDPSSHHVFLGQVARALEPAICGFLHLPGGKRPVSLWPPGIGFGKSGEGYVRIALVHPPEVLEAAVDRVSSFLNQNLP